MLASVIGAGFHLVEICLIAEEKKNFLSDCTEPLA